MLAPGAVFHFAAEVMRHELHAVADAEHRGAEIENGGVGMRRILGIDAGGAAAENQTVRFERGDFLGRSIEAQDLREKILAFLAPGGR